MNTTTRKLITCLCLLLFVHLSRTLGQRNELTADDVASGVRADREAGRENRLARESSPYLLLHAHNPVDWYGWGPEALDKARRENKPIFLSIGYSSCYWCHVMERLVFSNQKIADYMNQHFVNIKVDREERPDIDDIYMTALMVYLQAVGSPQGGGWPLSMFLTPEGKPFAGGTYFPPRDDGGRLGFGSIARRVIELWTEREAQIRGNGDLITSEVRRIMKPRAAENPPELTHESVARVVRAVHGSYDSTHGGFGFDPASPDQPKFPVSTKLNLMSYAASRMDDDVAGRAVLHTLDRIAAGGIRDHLAGGFHRYSTDRRWHVPHFEKMLYDQAQLAVVYAQAWKSSGKAEYREAAEGVLDYVLAELTDEQGGFYSALDAETDDIEGKYYVWSTGQVRQLLGEDDAKIFMQVYGMQEPNPFEHGYVLHLPRSLSEVAAELKTDQATLASRLGRMRSDLLAARSTRETPLRDDKILTSWNGLMLRAFALCGSAFERPDYTAAAERAADFLLAELRDEHGRLYRTWRRGAAKIKGYLDDYAFLVEGLLALHETTGNARWLSSAVGLSELQIRYYRDPVGKAFFFTPSDHEQLIVRTRNAYDNVLPSGNSVSVRNLIRLSRLSGDDRYWNYARETLDVFAPAMQLSPESMTNMAIALAEYLEGPAVKSSRTDAGPVWHAVGRVRQASADTRQRRSSDTRKKKKQYVTGKAFLSVDKLPAGGRCHIVMIVDIADGWHIYANPANPDNVIPTTFRIRSTYGTRLVDVRYPKSHKLKFEDFPETAVYKKRAVIRGVLEVPPELAGRTESFELIVDYQACTHFRCLRPSQVVLRGKVAVPRRQDEIRMINANLFLDADRGTSRN